MQPVKELSLDHVVPRSKGGKLTWTNTVAVRLCCNSKKGHTQVQDLPKIRMKLRMLPRVPSTNELQSKAKSSRRISCIPTGRCMFEERTGGYRVHSIPFDGMM